MGLTSGASRATSCEQCAELDKRIPLPTPASYLTLAGAARELLLTAPSCWWKAACRCVAAAGPAAPLRWNRFHPPPVACATCGRRYVLWADTYHGGGAWEPSTVA